MRVLKPQLAVEVDGAPLTLRPTAAKLLLALVIRHPRPLHVEEATELLWPDVTVDVRSRLNTLVHRLRSAAPTLSRCVARTGDLFAFDATAVDVDLFAYRAALSGTEPARRAALANVRGNLCDAQFPYDELLVDARRTLGATWLHHARQIVGGDASGVGDLAGPLPTFGLDLADLLPA